MPRPKNKEELLTLSQANFDKLFDYINKLSDKEKEFEFAPGTLNRNIRDVIAHLYHWHTMLNTWYHAGLKDEKPEIPARGYTWKTMPELNRLIQEKYTTTSLDEAIEMFKGSHESITGIIKKHTNDELFEKKRYKWTGTTSLGAYIISATSSHYDWALKLIKKGSVTS